jgi:succinyl-diaminopimelate desuccinylase
MTHVDRLDLAADVMALTAALVDVPSESFAEGHLADLVQAALEPLPHLTVDRLGDTVVARTDHGLPERVVVAGHLDTVPAAGNEGALLVPAGAPVPRVGLDGAATAADERLYGLGSCDMKGGVAVALKCAHDLAQTSRDVTYVFYACEEVAGIHNGLAAVVSERPELLAGADMAVLMEPSDAGVEAGCQGTLRVAVTTRGRRAHSARSWLGDNAVHAAGEILRRLDGYRPAEVDVDGLTYREGLNAVLIAGGVAGNVIPDECVVTVNYRFAPVRSEAEALAHVREVFDGFDLEVTDSAPGALPGLHLPAVRDFLVATGASPRPKFGWTDVARFTALGVPALNFGPGDPSLAHTADEHVPTAQLRSVHATMAKWLTAEAA